MFKTVLVRIEMEPPRRMVASQEEVPESCAFYDRVGEANPFWKKPPFGEQPVPLQASSPELLFCEGPFLRKTRP